MLVDLVARHKRGRRRARVPAGLCLGDTTGAEAKHWAGTEMYQINCHATFVLFFYYLISKGDDQTI